MKIKRITLFKTPLSNSYSDVFDTDDNINSKSEYATLYFNFLKNYKNMSSVVDNKSVNRINDNLNITLPYTYDDLHDYNYACVDYDERGRKFYFIVNLKEINSTTDGLVNCELEYDTFSNNFYDFKYGNYNNICLTQTRHIARYKIYKDGENEIIDVAKDYPSTPEIEPEDTQSFLAERKIKKYTVLFERMAVDNSVKFAHKDGEEIDVRPQSAHDFGNSYSYLRYVFYPVAVYEENTYHNVTNQFGGFRCPVAGNDNYVMPIGTSQFTSDFQTHFLYGSYTFNPPFTYRVVEIDGVKYIQGSCFAAFPQYDNPEFPSGSERYAIVQTYDLEFDVLYKKSDYNLLEPIQPYLNTYNLNDSYNAGSYEPTFYMYPWSYVSLFYNGSKNDIVQNAFNYDWKIDIFPRGENSNIMYRYYDENYSRKNLNNHTIYTTLNMNGTYPIYEDSYSVFIRNNGETFNTNYELNKSKADYNVTRSIANTGIDLASNYMTGGITGTIGGLKSVTNSSIFDSLVNSYGVRELHKAKIADMKNSTDNVQIPSQFCNSDRYNQDRVMVYRNIGTQGINYINLGLKLHYFGININTGSNVKINSRKHFDYVKCNLNCTSIFNIDERNKFNSIFINGVRLWHIDGFNSINSDLDEFRNAFLSFNCNISNNEKIFYL